MLLFLWLTRLRERWLGKLRGWLRKPFRSRSTIRQCLYRRLEVEPLESRLTPNVTLLSSYQGINANNSGGYVPPDTQGAAGPTSYVETTNQEIALYTPKNTGASSISDSLGNFFYVQGRLPQTDTGSELSDPVVTWDEQIQRFIVGDTDVDDNTHASNFDLAVSKSASPTTLTSADWNFFQVKTTENGYNADYPGNLGWNADALVFTLNMFAVGSGTDHVEINSVSINALADGIALKEGTNAFQTDFNGFNLRPTVMHDAKAGGPMWFVEEGGDNASINVVQMSNVLSDFPSFATTNLAVNPYYQAVPELQPDGSAITTDTDSRIMKAAMANGLLVAAHQVSDAAGNLDAIQWYVINTAGGTPTLQQEGDISGGPGTYYAYPGIDINSAGDIGVSYVASGTGTNQFLSMYVTGRTPNDPKGTMEKPVLVQAGLANNNDGREGDLSGISVDSDGTFWASNEFANSDGSWGTAIAHFTFADSVVTTANNLTTTYSTNPQTVMLSANVNDASNPTTKVNEGVVTFTVKSGSTILGSVQGAVTNGTAEANFTLPAGLAVGKYTIAVSYSDSSGNFFDGGDANAFLSVTPANVTTTANNLTTTYSTNPQTVTLSANVTDASIATDTVDEGTVTFTVLDGSAVLGSIQGTVTDGTAEANFTLPAGLAVGKYTIAVSYSDSSGNFRDDDDASGTLTVTPANVVTAANNVTTTYRPNPQTVTLSANVTDASIATDTVDEGTVTFTVLDGTAVLGVTQGTVTDGTAEANFTLPAGLAVGKYTIAVSYSDSSGNFTDVSDLNGILTITPAKVLITANPVSTVYSPKTPSLALGATITDTSIPGGIVNEGTVLFTILNGGTILGSVQAAVSNGTANANFTLPPGLAAGSYTITASYNDSQGNYTTGNDDPNTTLTVQAAATNAQLIQASLTPNLATLTATETLIAHVNSSTLVNQGTVTFILSGQTVSANVDGNGNAVANVVLPLADLLSPQVINITYIDPAHNLTASSDMKTASWQSPLLPSTATFASNTQTITEDLFGIFVTFTNGVLTEIDFGPNRLVFSYNAFGQLTQVIFNGIVL